MAGGAVVSGGNGGNPFKGFITRPFLWAFILTTSLFFLWGFAYGLLDVLNKHFQNTLGITKLESTGLQIAYFGLGYFCFSPVSAEVLKRFGYKPTFILGLSLYALGAILFWPVSHYSENTTKPKAIFAGFVVCTGVIACGLATLEVGANSYVSVMPPLNVANFRLQFSQSFNGVASFTGPLIASKYFFEGENASSNKNMQYVYLAVSMLGVLVAIAFFLTKLPEVSEAALEESAADEAEVADRGFWRTKAPFGFITQFMYVGAQVTIGSFFLNYAHENAGLTDTKGAQLLSYGLITFTVGRFVGTALLAVVDAKLLLGIYALACCVCVVLIASLKGMGGVICLIVIMFFESIMYPVIFVISTSKLGRHTRRAAGLLVMGVAGGAVFPPIQGAIADAASTRVSFWVALPAFVEIAGFAFWQWNKAGRPLRVVQEVVRDVQEEEAAYPHALPHTGREEDRKEDLDGKNDLEYVEKIRY